MAGERKSRHQQPAFEIGTPGMIRTCDLLIRSQALYPAELRVRKSNF
jgi:hypothetical protein